MDPSQIFELPVDRSLQPDGKTVDSRTLVSRNLNIFGRANEMAGIYLHIPFCKHKCTYCDFTSFPNRLNFAEAYMEKRLIPAHL